MSDIISLSATQTSRGGANVGKNKGRSGGGAAGGRPARAATAATTIPFGPRPEAIVKAFNTWAFKREQPDGLDLAERAAARAVAEGRPLPFVLYWGKGPRDGIAEPDLACLDYLASMGERVRAVHAPGAAIHLIFTDTHAALNGHAPARREAYFGAVGAAAAERGFATSRLSAVVASAEPALDGAAHEEPPEAVRDSLMACAAKWFRGEGSVEEGALEYYRMNMIEKRAVAIAFPDTIFVTFNGSDFRDLFPQAMPIFYMYSLRRGFGVKPWFLGHEVPNQGSAGREPDALPRAS